MNKGFIDFFASFVKTSNFQSSLYCLSSKGMHKSKECVIVGFAGEEKSNHLQTLVKQWVHTQVKFFGQKL